MNLDTQELKEAYAFGIDVGHQLSKFKEGIDVPTFLEGIKTVFENKEPEISTEEYQELMKNFQEKVQAKMKEEQEEASNEAKGLGEKFLAENKSNDGVKVTESGLQYKIIEQGNGNNATEDDTVEVHYEGKLLDGTVFDSSYQRGQTVSFALKSVIKGWTEGVQLMNPGSVYELYIPSDLAYGEAGAGGAIPPNSALIFKVELVSIK